MDNEKFAEAVVEAENLNFQILKYMVEEMDVELNDIQSFLSDIHKYVKQYSEEGVSVLFIHLYFMLFRLGHEEIVEKGIENTFSLLNRLYPEGEDDKKVFNDPKDDKVH